jgi:benzoate membrane transport protein
MTTQTRTQIERPHRSPDAMTPPARIDRHRLARVFARSVILRDVNAANVSAGLTAGLWYAFGGISVHLGVASSLHLSPAEASSWLFIICLTSGISALILGLAYRQPIAFGASIPGWLFLATVGGRYGLSQIAGASLMAGVLIVLAGPLGIGERIMRWLPLPIVMGMFAGSSLSYATGIFRYLNTDPLPVAMAIAGYLAARAFGRMWLPPLAVAGAAGFLGAMLGGQVQFQALQASWPVVAPVRPEFGLASFFALAVPLTVMAIGIGNVQGIGFLVSQGYRPPINLLTAVVGVNSIVNALFGGQPSTVARNGVAIVGGEDAGPREQRYVANIEASLCMLAIALGAASAAGLLQAFPIGLVATLAGLAILGALTDALRKSLVGSLSTGAFFALAIAASPLTILGIGSAFWALIGGWLVSFVLERPALRREMRGASDGAAG